MSTVPGVFIAPGVDYNEDAIEIKLCQQHRTTVGMHNMQTFLELVHRNGSCVHRKCWQV